jgi:GT2 family glycosyltransferase
VFLNNDTEVRTPEWLEEMVGLAERPGVGAVGPLLLYPDGTVQHAGVVLGLRGTADHIMRGFPGDGDGYAGSLSCTREVSAVTGACMLVRRDVLDELGGLDEHFATHYQDVDLCLRIRASGRRILYTPRAVLAHHEGATRGAFYDHVDRALLLDAWGETIGRGDPYYNPLLSLEGADYRPAAAA